MQLKNVLIVVNDIERSKKFYKDIFGLEVILDNEGNVILTAILSRSERHNFSYIHSLYFMLQLMTYYPIGGQIFMSNTGRTCKVHYTGTFNDGTKFDSSYDRGEPIEFVCGAGQMIPGFDQAVEGMNVGDIIDVHLRPEDAYGMPDPEAIIKAPLADMPGAENLEVGNQVYLANSMGQQFLVKVIEKDDESITFDANHEMAGKELNFKIELVSVD